ncbi:MAG TPA: hypothetical protein VE974_06135 [Thermoanaerobaculia bacterium]|nr:hypothetical protein [Thermoanaerobaculia bacterium]
MATKKAKTPFVPGVMRCDSCDKVIKGIHEMTIRSDWKGYGTPPEDAIVHVCSAACKRKSKEFEGTRRWW